MLNPTRVVLELSPFYDNFISSVGVNYNLDIYNEVLRQVFDIIDNPLVIFNRRLAELPRLEMLIDVNNFKSKPEIVQVMKNDIYEFGIGVYLLCVENKLFVNHKFNYMLESMQNNYCVLYYSEIPF